jgi:hypothetical protein
VYPVQSKSKQDLAVVLIVKVPAPEFASKYTLSDAPGTLKPVEPPDESDHAAVSDQKTLPPPVMR